MDKLQIKAELLKGSWFKELESVDQTLLLDKGQLLSLSSGEALFYRGDSDSGVYAVIDGHIRVSGLNSLGEESILTFVEPGAWFGELALFDGSTRTHDAHAAGDVRLFHISSRQLTELLGAHPHLWKSFGLMLAHKLRLSFDLIEDLSLLPAPKRLAKRLILMSEGYGEVGTTHVLNIGQSSLAAMLSISRQTTNHILKSLETNGWISMTYGRIQVLDIESLRRFVIDG